MFRREVNPKTAAVAVVVILAAVQFTYWRILVYQPPGRPGTGGGGGAMEPPKPLLQGLDQVQVQTFAGGEPGLADGPGWQARFCGPNALALDDQGLIVADSRNHRVRRVAFSGRVSTVAGSGKPNGEGGRAVGPAAQAAFRFPSGVAAVNGSIAVADTGNHRICLIRGGMVTELAGGTEGHRDGAGSAAEFRSPSTMVVGPDQALWVLDAGDMRVRRVDLQGSVTTPAQVPLAVRNGLGRTQANAPSERIGGWEEAWMEPAESPFELGYRGGGVAPAGAPLVFPDAEHGVVMVQAAGHIPLLVAGRRTEIAPTPASFDGDGTRSAFAVPTAAVTAPDGVVYVAEYEGNRIRKLTLPDWLRTGQFTAPEPRGRWRRSRGN